MLATLSQPLEITATVERATPLLNLSRASATPSPCPPGSNPGAAGSRTSPPDVILSGLLGGVARGERKALQALYGHTAGLLGAVCLRIVRDDAGAQDALQETYLSVWRRAGSFDCERGGAMAWLTTVARNKAIDRLRMMRSRPSGSDELLGRLVAPEPAADHQLEQAESSAWIHRQLDRLPPDTAWALKSAFFHGLTYSELARCAGVPEATMKSRVRRALLQLRKSWTEDSAHGAA